MESMEYVTLNNGIKMPILGFGVYQIRNSECKCCCLDAFKSGYRHIDTAQWYGNESGVGDAIIESGIPRNEIFITTKIGSGRNVAEGIETSLKKLKSDYIDLLLIHWVQGNDLEIWRIMESYVKKGKVKSIGLSNFFGNDYDNIIKNCEIKPVCNQIETHVFRQNLKDREIFKKNNVYLESWAPFAEGKRNMFSNKILSDIGKKYNKTVAQIILRFLTQENIIVIPKTTHIERMKENINIFDFKIKEDDMKIIRKMNEEAHLFGWN